MATQLQEKTETPEVIAKEIAADRAQRREERQGLVAIPSTDLATSPANTSFAPQNLGEVMQFARLMAASNFVPAHLRGNESDCTAIVLIAARWGMDPFAVATKSYFVKPGAPAAFESQLVNAVVNSSGVLSGRLRIEYVGTGEALRCTVSGFLKADPNELMVKTQLMARITTRNSPLWKADPEQQLGYYTTRAWARLYCPEVLLGVYTPDELDLDPERARVVSPPRRADPLDIAEAAEIAHKRETEIVPMTKREKAEAEAAAAGADPVTGEIVDNGEMAKPGEQTKHPAEAAADQILKDLKACETIVDVNKLRERVGETVDAMPDEIADLVVKAFLTAEHKLTGK
jgi:hypothetical protein